MTVTSATATTAADGRSARLRVRTLGKHRATEGAPIVKTLLQGRQTLDRFITITGQRY